MIRVGKLTEYAVVLLSQLARAEGGVRAVAQLATAASLPEPTVAKVLKNLTKAGLVASHRGAAGGYSLEASLAEISLASVLVAMEGPIALTACLEDGHACDCMSGKACPLRRNWGRVNEAIAGALEGVSLAELVGVS